MSTILVIEDDRLGRQLVISVLEAHGYTVVAAPNGVEGVKLARQHRPDLIVADINMPELDGYGVLLALREDESTAAIPFIFLSAKEEKEDIRKAMNLGADDYITKPFELSLLLDAVRTRLEKQATVTRQTEKKLDELRRNIAYAMPHELRTPLAIVRGYTELLAEDFKDTDPDHAHMMLEIRRSATRLQQLAENFWTFAEMELIQDNPRWAAELGASVEDHPAEIIQTIAVEVARERGRESDLSFQLESTAVRVFGEHFKKIIRELVSNAFKFSAAGTPVQVTTVAQDDTFTLRITDHGRGMTPEQIADVGAYMQFERRYYEQQGVGLGLFIAGRLAALYGGSLAIESVLGEGTTVSVALHLDQDVQATPVGQQIHLPNPRPDNEASV